MTRPSNRKGNWLAMVMMVAAVCTQIVAGSPAYGASGGDKNVQLQAGAETSKRQYAHPVLVADTVNVVAGKPFRLGIELVMDKGWHTYYKESGEAGMPTTVQWQLPAGFVASELVWEKPHKFSDSGIVTYGYTDKTVIAATITPPADLPPGTSLKFGAKVKWLTCNEVCVPGNEDSIINLVSATSSQSINLEKFVNVTYTGPAEAASTAVPDVKPAAREVGPPALEVEPGGDAADSSKRVTGVTSRAAADLTTSVLDTDLHVAGAPESGIPIQGGLLGVFLCAFVGGMILNLMPCVLPVISIKIFGLMQQAGEDPKKVFQHGMIFTAGILSSFLTLGGLVVALQSAGSNVGWGFQFQYPVFVFAMACIVTIFSMAMFGLFYFSVNAGSKIDKLASSEGLAGTFFKGVLATTLSTPCSAPFLGTALGFAFTQPSWIILAVFLTIGLGMSAPYLALTARPRWMKYLPKPGTWMETFKESMGFLLVATVVWLVWVLGKQVGLDACMAAVAFLVVISFASWLVGRYVTLSASVKTKTTVWSAAMLITAMGWFFLLRPFPVLLSTTPAQVNGAESHISNADDGIQWRPFTISELDKQVSNNKTVLIDFTADWCLTCKANEATVINTKPVVEKIRSLNVVSLRADWTSQDASITKLLRKFGRSGVPLYVIFPANRANEPIVLPEVVSREIVLQALDRAGASK